MDPKPLGMDRKVQHPSSAARAQVQHDLGVGGLIDLHDLAGDLRADLPRHRRQRQTIERHLASIDERNRRTGYSSNSLIDTPRFTRTSDCLLTAPSFPSALY